ncbi:hypothetical protein F946_01064 [Acinetobacter johnsonii ANC 3681]|uniref:Uncharacterized protein n=1 Tax=Acinetobacter johnsonii ANC 3681 TaxID=1217662 RepID=N9BIT5_ACIJO|nr:hypothetical protein [Acinetobacter johnsonii]ENV73552.1 hypothetical protein F946_01064 [Acinetobacter johnsonii ANC 3681]
MFEYFVNFSTWAEGNSGQIQIVIAAVAIWYVLKQIKISNNQTNLSLDQTKISIAQMDKLNNERLFELRLRLKIRIGDHSKTLMELQDATNDLSSRLLALSIDTKENHPESFDVIEDMIKCWRESSIQSAWDIIKEKMQENREYLKKIATTKDISLMEEILDKVEQNQVIYQSKMHEIRSLDAHVTKVWMPMNMGISEALRRMYNFE